MSFEVPMVSLHVHERVDPRTIIESVRKRNGADRQKSLFEVPEENPPIRQAIEFYQHRHNWSNQLVAGDSLLVMNSLLTIHPRLFHTDDLKRRLGRCSLARNEGRSLDAQGVVETRRRQFAVSKRMALPSWLTAMVWPGLKRPSSNALARGLSRVC